MFAKQTNFYECEKRKLRNTEIKNRKETKNFLCLIKTAQQRIFVFISRLWNGILLKKLCMKNWVNFLINALTHLEDGRKTAKAGRESLNWFVEDLFD